MDSRRVGSVRIRQNKTYMAPLQIVKRTRQVEFCSAMTSLSRKGGSDMYDAILKIKGAGCMRCIWFVGS